MNLEELLNRDKVSKVVVYELRAEGDKIIPTIKIPLCLKGKLSLINDVEGKDRIIAGYASIAVVDLENQIIPIETLQEGIQSLLKDPHYANLMLVHKNIQIGKIIESYGDQTTHVDENGLFIVCEIRKDIKVADEIWNSILKGELNGFSIGCEVLLDHDECDGEKCVTVLDKINIFEVSVCSEPINKGSGFIVISKAKSNEEIPVNNCSCLLNKEDNMVKKKVLKKDETEEKTEEKAEEVKEEKSEATEEVTEEKATIEAPEISVMDRLDSLERTINSLVGFLQNSVTEEKKKEEDDYEEDEPENTDDMPTEEDEEMAKSKEKVEEAKEEEKSVPCTVQEEKATIPQAEPVEDSSIKSIIEELSKKMDSILEKLSKDDAVEELNMALKSRDDKIAELEKKVTIVEKSKDVEEVVEEQKTIEEEEEDFSDYSKSSTLIIKSGIITRPL